MRRCFLDRLIGPSRRGLWTAAAILYATAAGATIPPAEREALIAIYQSTNGGAWGLNTNWCTTSPCPAENPVFAPRGTECYSDHPGDGWYGVECDVDRTHVLFINLSANNLSGSLPSIAAFTALADFLVSDNDLRGPVPDLRALTALRSVDVSANHLSGTLPSLAGLADLEAFVASENELAGEIPNLDGLGALKAFDVRANRLTGAIPRLTGHAELIRFDASGNTLTGSIPDLSGLYALEYFYVNCNQLAGSIPPLAGLRALARIDLSGNRLTGAIPALPPALQVINVGDNQLSGPVPPAPPSLSQSRSRLCPNPLDTSPDGNFTAWNAATGFTPWWADPAKGVVCDDLLAAGFDLP